MTLGFVQPASQCSEVQEFSTSANQTCRAPPLHHTPHFPNTPSKMRLHAHSTLPCPFLWLHWISANCNLPAFMENNFSCSLYHLEMKYLGISLVAALPSGNVSILSDGKKGMTHPRQGPLPVSAPKAAWTPALLVSDSPSTPLQR